MIPVSEIYPVDPRLHPGNFTAGLMRSFLMHSNLEMQQRKALGWQGLRPVCGVREGWTCRIKGKEGIYGIRYEGQEKDHSCLCGSFRLYYFPQKDEEIADSYSVQAGIYAQLPHYEALVREFPVYPAFNRHFDIGELKLHFDADHGMLSAELCSPEHIYSACPEEVLAWIEESPQVSPEPEDLVQNLPARDLAFSFFDIFTASIAVCLDGSVQERKRVSTGNITVLETGFAEKDPGSKDCISEGNRAFPETGNKIRPTSSGRPELIVLTGFLGSGKTTFLKEFIEYHVGFSRFVAVIQNEIGAQGLDGKLLEDDYAVLEMDEGCVCCSLVGQLKLGILKILEDHHPNIIVLETTGLANPFNLLDEIHEIGDLVHFQSVCTIVDGKNFMHSTTYSGIALDQVKAADQVILNKTDLLTEKQEVDLREKIHQLNPEAVIHSCSHGKISPSKLNGTDRKNPALRYMPLHQDHTHDGIGSKKIIINRKLNRESLIRQLHELPSSIYRVKGVVDIQGQNNPFVLQYVNGSFSLESMTRHIPGERFLVLIGKKETLNKRSIF